MGTDPTSRTILTLLGLGCLLWLVYLVRDLLPPFLLAFALATVMEPVAQRFQAAHLPRGLAVALTFLTFLAIFFGGVIVLLPLAVSEAAQLVGQIPTYYQDVMANLSSVGGEHSTLKALFQRYNIPGPMGERLVAEYQAQLGRYLQDLLGYIGNALKYTAGRLIWVIIVPIVALYTVIDYERIRTRAFHLIPDVHRDRTTEIAAAVTRVFISYLRGLFLVCVSYGLTLGVVLGLGFRLPYALVLAIAGGILYAVPYIGPVATIAVSAMVAWAAFDGALGYTLAVAGVALFINEVFDFVITPKVLSRQTGLHPVLNIFALMVGGSLFGFVGLILAVPVAASIKEVLRHFYPRLTEPLGQEGQEKPARRAWRWPRAQL